MSRYADTSKGMTQQQVAAALGISVARVGQLENSALRKLRLRTDTLAALGDMADALEHNRSDTHVLRFPR